MDQIFTLERILTHLCFAYLVAFGCELIIATLHLMEHFVDNHILRRHIWILTGGISTFVVYDWIGNSVDQYYRFLMVFVTTYSWITGRSTIKRFLYLSTFFLVIETGLLPPVPCLRHGNRLMNSYSLVDAFKNTTLFLKLSEHFS